MKLETMIKFAKTEDERIAANAALNRHNECFGSNKTRAITYSILVNNHAHQIEVTSNKKYMIAEVRNCHRKLIRIAGVK